MKKYKKCKVSVLILMLLQLFCAVITWAIDAISLPEPGVATQLVGDLCKKDNNPRIASDNTCNLQGTGTGKFANRFLGAPELPERFTGTKSMDCTAECNYQVDSDPILIVLAPWSGTPNCAPVGCYLPSDYCQVSVKATQDQIINALIKGNIFVGSFFVDTGVKMDIRYVDGLAQDSLNSLCLLSTAATSAADKKCTQSSPVKFPVVYAGSACINKKMAGG